MRTQQLFEDFSAANLLNLLDGSDGLVADTGNPGALPGAATENVVALGDDALYGAGPSPVQLGTDPNDPDGDELTDPDELQEIVDPKQIENYVPSVDTAPLFGAANDAWNEAAGLVVRAGDSVGLGGTANDVIGIGDGTGLGSIGSSSSSPLTDIVDLPGQILDTANGGVETTYVSGTNAVWGGVVGIPSLINDASEEAFNDAAPLTAPVSGLVSDIESGTGLPGGVGTIGDLVSDLTGLPGNLGSLGDLGSLGNLAGVLGTGPIAQVEVAPGGVLGLSGLLDAVVNPSASSLITIDALGTDNGGGSNLADVNALPSSLGTIANLDALTGPVASDGAIGAFVGNGPSLLDANLLNGTLPGTVGDLIGGSSGSHLIDANVLPTTVGDIANLDVLTAPAAPAGAVSALVANGPNLVTADLLTGHDALQLGGLNSANLDSLSGVALAQPTAAAATPVTAVPLGNVADIADVSGLAGHLDPIANIVGTAHVAHGLI